MPSRFCLFAPSALRPLPSLRVPLPALARVVVGVGRKPKALSSMAALATRDGHDQKPLPKSSHTTRARGLRLGTVPTPSPPA